MSKVYLATKEDLENIEGVKTFESKEAYEAAKTAGVVKDGEVVGYPYEGEVVGTPIDKELSETSENPVQNKVVYAQFTNVANEIVNLKNSVSNGKTLVANAITEKGVATESTDEFSVMASNIGLIETGKKTLVLPTNPDLSIKGDDSKLVLSWTQPETEVEIDHYNIYTSLEVPMSLKDMTKVGSVECSSNVYGENLLPKTISKIENGLIAVFNTDGSLSISGTTTSGGSIIFEIPTLTSGHYKYSTSPKGGTEKTYYGNINIRRDGTNYSNRDYGDGCEFDLDISTDTVTSINFFTYEKGITINETIYPYLRKLENLNTYTLTNLTNDQTYYVGIQSVTADGYENASIWKVQNGVPSAIRFVCVGNSGKSYYSTDGINWIAMSGLSGQDYQGITYGNGRFVAVGGSGKSYYSTDGLNWITMTGISSSDSLYAVVYGDGKFVCVGYNGNSYYSTNGTSWTAMSGLSSYSYYGVAYGNGRFVAVGERGYSYYSTDGTTWIAMSGLVSDTYRGVTYGNGRFVAVGGSGKSYYSTDGINWIAMSGLNTSNTYRGVTYGNGRFVCVGHSGFSAYSTDGINWTAMSGLDTTNHYHGVTYGNGRFVAVGESGKSYYSTDGINWVAMSGLGSYAYYGVTNNKWNEG